MKKLSLGLVGLGHMGKIHLYNCLRIKNADLVAVSDTSKTALNFARKIGVNNVYSDYHLLLESSEIDAVIITLPTFLHYECAKTAAAEGKDIFLEKPLASEIGEGEEMLAYVKRNDVKMMVGYHLRFVTAFQNLKNDLESGTIGDVQMAIATFVGSGPFYHRRRGNEPAPVPDWYFDNRLVGGALLDTGSHVVNLLRWYFGDVASAKSYVGHRFHMDFEDHVAAILKFENGTISMVNVGWFSEDMQVKVELYGTVAHRCAGYASRTGIDFVKNAIMRKIHRKPVLPMGYEPYFTELKYFVDCVSTDTQPNPSGEEALEDLKTIFLIYKSRCELPQDSLLSTD